MRAALCLLAATLVQSFVGTTSEGHADDGDTMAAAILAHNKPYSQYKMTQQRTNLVNHYFSQYILNTYKHNKKQMKKDLYIPDDHPVKTDLALHRENINNIELRQYYYNKDYIVSKHDLPRRRVKRQEEMDPRCEDFKYTNKKSISNPKSKEKRDTYPNNTNCVSVINGVEGKSIRLTFVDVFHIEAHPDCAYDYLEIRDGKNGYANLLGKVCGESFPAQISSTGPDVWLKFHSDDTIEYEGFNINVEFIENAQSRAIPEDCFYDKGGVNGIIDSDDAKECKKRSSGHALDVLWRIRTDEGTKIYLNFTQYSLAKPNECEENIIMVFGSVLEYDANIDHFCGSVPQPISTKDAEGNIMYVRLFASRAAAAATKFTARYTAYRSLSAPKDGNPASCEETEFNCEDNTCIDGTLRCDGYADCRLKTDEEDCASGNIEESGLDQPHIKVVLVIFSLLLSGMSFVFLFKCARKLYQDHKLIKEHIRQSTEDRLDSLAGSRLLLDARQLQRAGSPPPPRASLERDNRANEMYKQQRKLSQMKPSSIDSDFIQETQLDLEDETWGRDIETLPKIIDTEDIRIESNGRTRRSDMSKKEESIRSKTRESDEKREIRDVSVGAPDTKESACQTRESLFQADSATAPSSDGSGSNSRGFSTFGYSGATIARQSPPPPAPPAAATAAPPHATEITFELLHQVPHDAKSQKKMSDRRPMSSETTRSAPDVIIVSKPIR